MNVYFRELSSFHRLVIRHNYVIYLLTALFPFSMMGKTAVKDTTLNSVKKITALFPNLFRMQSSVKVKRRAVKPNRRQKVLSVFVHTENASQACLQGISNRHMTLGTNNVMEGVTFQIFYQAKCRTGKMQGSILCKLAVTTKSTCAK